MQGELRGVSGPASETLAGNTATPRQHVLGRLIDSQTHTAQRLRWTVAVVAIAVGLLHLRIPVGSLLGPALYERDILQGYTLARAIMDGTDPYLPVPELAARYVHGAAGQNLPHPTPHPPTLGLLLLPLAWFDFSTVAVGWLMVEVACLVVSVYLLGQALAARLSIGQSLAIAAALLIWYPFWVEMTWGQLHLPMLALLAGAWLAWRTERPLLGGALVGLAILFKPVPWPLLLWFALRKHWRALGAAVAVVCAGYLAAIAVLGIPTIVEYFAGVLPTVSSHYRAAWSNISVSSLAWRLFDGTGTGALIVAPPAVKWPAAAAVGSVALPCLLVLLLSHIIWRQRDGDVSWAATVGASVLTVPIAWPAYLVFAAIPGAQVIRWLRTRRFPPRETNWALVVTMLLVVDWQALGRLLIPLVRATHGGALPGLALILLPLVPMMTTLAVAALIGLVVCLGPVQVAEHRPVNQGLAKTPLSSGDGDSRPSRDSG
jgi:hypothetical protein